MPDGGEADVAYGAPGVGDRWPPGLPVWTRDGLVPASSIATAATAATTVPGSH